MNKSVSQSVGGRGTFGVRDAASNLEHRRPRHPLRLLQLSQPAAAELHLGGHPRRGRRVLGRTVTGYPIPFDLGRLKDNE